MSVDKFDIFLDCYLAKYFCTTEKSGTAGALTFGKATSNVVGVHVPLVPLQ